MASDRFGALETIENSNINGTAPLLGWTRPLLVLPAASSVYAWLYLRAIKHPKPFRMLNTSLPRLAVVEQCELWPAVLLY